MGKLSAKVAATRVTAVVATPTAAEVTIVAFDTYVDNFFDSKTKFIDNVREDAAADNASISPAQEGAAVDTAVVVTTKPPAPGQEDATASDLFLLHKKLLPLMRNYYPLTHQIPYKKAHLPPMHMFPLHKK